MSTAPAPAAVLFGSPLAVTYRDGRTESITLAEPGLRVAMSAATKAMTAKKDPGWADTLATDSQLAAYDLAVSITDPILARWHARQSRALQRLSVPPVTDSPSSPPIAPSPSA